MARLLQPLVPIVPEERRQKNLSDFWDWESSNKMFCKSLHVPHTMKRLLPGQLQLGLKDIFPRFLIPLYKNNSIAYHYCTNFKYTILSTF
jgi:hypothetical protein